METEAHRNGAGARLPHHACRTSAVSGAGITKQELLDYYGLVAQRMLPHVANRPLTLVRCPNGQGKPASFKSHPVRGTAAGSALGSNR